MENVATEEFISRTEALKALFAPGMCYAPMQLQIIKDLPAADVAPVVRCKGCKYRTENGNCGHPRHHGILPSAYPYDFCSYGERREE